MITVPFLSRRSGGVDLMVQALECHTGLTALSRGMSNNMMRAETHIWGEQWSQGRTAVTSVCLDQVGAVPPSPPQQFHRGR
ncbi:hypothetical protein NDU88_003129 [Pleurodeles waltl]|uniref:Uncharacterized protein n=1 Tax=Pleurodeles waltl TaxID=8319 RepID=A0AAV7L0Z5_PLEWA|nr:hypothetical protein NDU88_003129 [Pleurodeles waltl]